MKTTTFWWTVVGACALACEAADDVRDNEAPLVDDDPDICVTEEGSCGPDDLTLEAIHEGPCGSHPTASEVAVMERDFEARLAAAPPQPRIQADIDVYVHVIQGGWVVDEALINQQMMVLNERFSMTGFKFTLKALNYVDEPDWYYMYMDSPAETEMKDTLRQGESDTLNIYILDAQGGYLGWATFPWNYWFDPKDDGVILDKITLPDKSTKYNEGDTLVHEVGHWLGLYHTFQNGCGWFGDFVSDTPAEKSPASDCPMGFNTCAAAGNDPTDNFMDYTKDSCRKRFTPGQINRMASQFNSFR